MKVLLTGATGVVGRRLVPLLLAAGHEVAAVVRTSGKAASVARAGAKPMVADLFFPEAMRRAAAGADIVINLATSQSRSRASLGRFPHRT